jgi:hypothetical protein
MRPLLIVLGCAGRGFEMPPHLRMSPTQQTAGAGADRVVLETAVHAAGGGLGDAASTSLPTA